VSPDRQRLRARVFLRGVLPLLEVVVRERPELSPWLFGARGVVQFEATGSGLGARLSFDKGKLTVDPAPAAGADLRFVFRDVASLNAFFAGKPVLPRIEPFGGLGAPLLLARTLRLLSALRVLEPPAPGASPPDPPERALRVRLVLYLVTRALSGLNQDGYGPMRELSEGSPERVYQWTVGGSDIAAYLRVHAGRVKAGRGVYARRRPFVHFVFPDPDAAFAVLMATGSQMSGFRGGRVETFGSPEYTRKIALLMQKVDELLMEG
jgi:hypothetical protein